jgi:hypothetical protein
LSRDTLAASADAEPQVGDLTGRRNERPVERDRPEVTSVDEANAIAQEDRYQVDHDLVEKPGAEALGCDGRSEDDDIVAVGGVDGSRDCVAQLT